jgi:hypothetical protein
MSTKLIYPFLFAILCASCSDGTKCEGAGCGEQQEASPASGAGGTEGERPPEREGPAGCYIEAEHRCDCELEEAECTEDGQIWTDGCATCAT